jgi:hypothetical protein
MDKVVLLVNKTSSLNLEKNFEVFLFFNYFVWFFDDWLFTYAKTKGRK